MNIQDQMREVARDDSRRFATGIRCKIIGGTKNTALQMHERKILELLNRKKGELIPRGVFLLAPEERPYMSAVTGHFCVMPISSYSIYEELLKSIFRPTIDILADAFSPMLESLGIRNINESTETEKMRKLNLEEVTVNFLKQSMILVRHRPNLSGDFKLYDPRSFDVLVDTRDIGQSKIVSYLESSGSYTSKGKLNE